MPSFLDIPKEYRIIEGRAEFVNWLSSMPIPQSAKRRLVQLWVANCNATLTPAEYGQIMTNPVPVHGE